MANHCIYAVCLTCQIEFCVRCLDVAIVAEEVSKKILEKAEAGQAKTTTVRCPRCRSPEATYLL